MVSDPDFYVEGCAFDGALNLLDESGRSVVVNKFFANVQVHQHCRPVKIFRAMFFEIPGELVWIAGIDDGEILNVPIDSDQAGFVAFLHHATAIRRDRQRSRLRASYYLFEGGDYAIETRATLAYMAARGLTHDYVIGFCDEVGQKNYFRASPDDLDMSLANDFAASITSASGPAI